MRSYDYYGFTYDADVYCTACLPVPEDSEEASPIFADSEWDYVPACCVCGAEMDYVTVLTEEPEHVREYDRLRDLEDGK